MTMTDFGCYLMMAGAGLMFFGMVIAIAGLM